MLNTKRPTQNDDIGVSILIGETMMCTAAYVVQFYTVGTFWQQYWCCKLLNTMKAGSNIHRILGTGLCLQSSTDIMYLGKF